MGLTMNRFLLIPKLKPEFKMVQPLPAFLGISTVKPGSAAAPETLTRNLSPEYPPIFLAAAKMQSFTTNRKSTS